jgi:small multidrug resistance pump
VVWVWFAGAISLECIATLNLKASEGFSRILPSIVVVLGYVGSFALLGAVLKRLDVGIVYAIWSGVGTVVVVSVGFAMFGESITAMKLVGVGVIIVGVIVVNLSGTHDSAEAKVTEASQQSPAGADGAVELNSAPVMKAVRHGTRRRVVDRSETGRKVGVADIPRPRVPAGRRLPGRHVDDARVRAESLRGPGGRDRVESGTRRY